jgi:hypothetical protein
MSETRLSLFQIESELLGLIDQREDALERLAMSHHPDSSGVENMSSVIEEELAVIDGLIRDYLKREVKKVDGIAFAVKEYEARAVAQAEEAKQMIAKAEKNSETVKRIKQMVLEVMQEFGEKKLPGRLFTISRQGNGGVQPLTIAQPDLVPLEMKRVTVELKATVVEDFAEQFAGQYRVTRQAEPDAKDIRVALERGEGVMGARLEERGEHIRIK